MLQVGLLCFVHQQIWRSARVPTSRPEQVSITSPWTQQADLAQIRVHVQPFLGELHAAGGGNLQEARGSSHWWNGSPGAGHEEPAADDRQGGGGKEEGDRSRSGRFHGLRFGSHWTLSQTLELCPGLFPTHPTIPSDSLVPVNSPSRRCYYPWTETEHKGGMKSKFPCISFRWACSSSPAG